MAPNPFSDSREILPTVEPRSSISREKNPFTDSKEILPTVETRSPSLSSSEKPTPEKQTPSFWFKADAFITEWTPFTLVVSYFVFSVCLYLICTPKLISVFWFIYLITNSYIAASTVIEAVMSLTPNREARAALRRVEQNNWIFPTPDDKIPIMDLLIVAYLPNEKDIIMDRIHYATEKIIYPRDKIRVTILYNTPVAIEPLETEMAELATKISHLRIIKVPQSTSKADNLNYFFTLDTGSDIIAIFDCDHYPHPYGPRFAAENFMADQETQVVQGRCIVFNTKAGFIPAMVAVEFDKIYAVSHPGRAVTWDFGIFCGSNGYWRTNLLREHGMDGEMLTEDIDSALRAFAKHKKIVHDLNCISYELAPTKMKAFWNQRLRWAQGWCQASGKHFIHSFRYGEPKTRTKRQRFGLFSLLLIRELSYYLVTQYVCLVFSIVITSFPTSGSLLVKFLFFQYPVAYWLFIFRYVFPRIGYLATTTII